MTRCSTFPVPYYLPSPPEPVVPAETTPSQVVTPPPSPKLRGRASRLPNGFGYWGMLKPRNVHAPFSDWYFGRGKSEYKVGYSLNMDYRAMEVPTLMDHQCTIRWDGTDGPNAASIIDHSAPHASRSVVTGTFVNGQRLKPNHWYTLTHGSTVKIFTSAVMGPHEDLNFVWLQCRREGWIPLQYEQYSGLCDPESLLATFA